MDAYYKGAITFEDDAALQASLKEAQTTLNQQADSIIGADELETLGLHLTISHHTSGTAQQIEAVNQVIKTLVAHAYSGYIDVTVDGDETRYHAKEIDPTPVEQIEEKMGIGNDV